MVQIAVAGGAGLSLCSAFVFGPARFHATPALGMALLATGLLATALAFTTMAWAQQYTSPTRAALILALEPAVAWLTSYVVTGEILSNRGKMGAGLILAGVLLVELKRSKPETLNYMSFIDKARNQKFLIVHFDCFHAGHGSPDRNRGPDRRQSGEGSSQRARRYASDHPERQPDAKPLSPPSRRNWNLPWSIFRSNSAQPVSAAGLRNSVRGRQPAGPPNPDNGDGSGSSPEDLFRRFFGGGGGNGLQINPFGGEQMPVKSARLRRCR